MKKKKKRLLVFLAALAVLMAVDACGSVVDEIGLRGPIVVSSIELPDGCVENNMARDINVTYVSVAEAKKMFPPVPDVASVAVLPDSQPLSRGSEERSKMLPNEKIVWQILSDHVFPDGRKLDKAQVAAIMGNLQQEHNFNLDGDGLAQWKGVRLQRLLDWCAEQGLEPLTYEAQVQFMLDELYEFYGPALDKVLASNNIADITVVFCNEYLGAGVPLMEKRIAYANGIHERH
jgi:hypothetical protein